MANVNEELIKKFLRVESCSGYGYGSGYGSGDGSGYGYGSGYGSGDGYGYGSGYGDGDGSGDGSGYGYGSGYGSGDGSDDGVIKSFKNERVYKIDGVNTIIRHIVKNVAKGYILNSDFTLEACYIVKGHNKFAHGNTLAKALEDLQNKIFEDIDTEEAIEMFLKEFPKLNKKYPAKAFYIWHNRLTGSCEMGRNSFVKNNDIDLENDTFTVEEFISLTRNEYGGEIIRQLESRLKG